MNKRRLASFDSPERDPVRRSRTASRIDKPGLVRAAGLLADSTAAAALGRDDAVGRGRRAGSDVLVHRRQGHRAARADRAAARAREGSTSSTGLRRCASRTLEISVPDLVELRAAMHAFRATKKLRCHAEGANNATYLLLAACDTIGLAPLGELAIAGPRRDADPRQGPCSTSSASTPTSSTSARTRARPSRSRAMRRRRRCRRDARRDPRSALRDDGRHRSRRSRKLAPDAVKDANRSRLFPAEEAKTRKLVDEVATFEAFRDAITSPWDHESRSIRRQCADAMNEARAVHRRDAARAADRRSRRGDLRARQHRRRRRRRRARRARRDRGEHADRGDSRARRATTRSKRSCSASTRAAAARKRPS